MGLYLPYSDLPKMSYRDTEKGATKVFCLPLMCPNLAQVAVTDESTILGSDRAPAHRPELPQSDPWNTLNLAPRRSSPFIRLGAVLISALVVAVGAAYGEVDQPSHGEQLMVAQQHNRQIVTGKEEISTDLDWVYRVAWSPDSRHFAVIGSKGSGDLKGYSVLVYDASTQKVIKVFPVKQPGLIAGDIAFSPDGKYLAAGIGVISLWDAHTWQPVHDIEGPHERGFVGGGVQSIAFSPDGKSLAVLYESVAWPETVVIRTREEAAVWAKKEEAAKKDGTFWEKRAKAEILSRLSTIMAFDVETNKRIFVQTGPALTPEGGGHFTGNLTFTADGKYLVTSRGERPSLLKLKSGMHDQIRTFLELRDPRTGHLLKEIEGIHVMEITAVAVSPDGKSAATGTRTLSKESTLNQPMIDNRDPVRLWSLAGGDKVMEYGPLRGAVRALAFSPDSNLLVSCQTDLEKKETLWIWDVASGQLIERVSTPRSGHEFFGCAMSPNGRFVALPVLGTIYLIGLQQ